jgi:hypothetical protein
MAASSQKGQFEPYHSHPSICDRICRKLRLTLCEKETTFASRSYSDKSAFGDKADIRDAKNRWGNLENKPWPQSAQPMSAFRCKADWALAVRAQRSSTPVVGFSNVESPRPNDW